MGPVPLSRLDDRARRADAHALPVSRARFVDPTRVEALGRLGISTVGQLVRHYPFRYLDLSRVVPLRDVRAGAEATVVGRIHEIKVKKPRPRLTITEVALFDGTGLVLGVWFNQPYIQQRYRVGERVAFAGKVELDYGFKQIKTPFVERLPDEDEGPVTGHILPVHRTTDGLSTNWLRRLIAASIDDVSDTLDHLPATLRIARGLVPLRSALREIQFPPSMDAAHAARRRLAYDELLLLQLYMAMRRHALTREQAGFAHRVDGPALSRLRDAVPHDLTADQRTAIAEILGDLALDRPMNRMLLGDVGTGKTLVAAHALAAVADSGSQAAMMAPTEVLAQQYALAVGPLLDEAGVPWTLLTGSTSAADRRTALAGIEDGSVTVAFGTHALLEESVRFARLSLSIVDEQHRFGVGQRSRLRGKGATADMLVMTATPIPRSLALTLYGDLTTSYLRERPKGRPPVRTTVLRAPARAFERVTAAVREGRQAYVVYALVDESDAAQAKAATAEFERLGRTVFPGLRLGLLTGRMRPAEKTAVMAAFRAGEIDVLVSTTVIEVGVDVPNATVMVIENAERFGLAQLHQLRGRVGRGEWEGEVYLVSDARSTESRERLDVVASTPDGFDLAEADLRLRGEGQVLGLSQHGLPQLALASVLTDTDLLQAAREDAAALIDADPHLRAPEHGPLLGEVKRVFADAWKWVSAG